MSKEGQEDLIETENNSKIKQPKQTEAAEKPKKTVEVCSEQALHFAWDWVCTSKVPSCRLLVGGKGTWEKSLRASIAEKFPVCRMQEEPAAIARGGAGLK